MGRSRRRRSIRKYQYQRDGSICMPAVSPRFFPRDHFRLRAPATDLAGQTGDGSAGQTLSILLHAEIFTKCFFVLEKSKALAQSHRLASAIFVECPRQQM